MSDTPRTDAVTAMSLDQDDGKYMTEDLLFHARKLERTLRKESRRLDWLINELDGWDRDNIDDAIDREETEELKREKLEADAKYDINWEDEE